MEWKEGHLALVLAAVNAARASFFEALSFAAISNVRPDLVGIVNTEDQTESSISDLSEADEKFLQSLKELSTPQVLIIAETIFALSQKEFSNPDNLKAFIERHNKDMEKSRKFYGGFTIQGVSKGRYEKAIFGKRAVAGALFHWRNHQFRCDISFLQKVLGPQMAFKTCADTLELLIKYKFLNKEPAGSSSLITSNDVLEPLVEAYLDKMLEYGAMAKCIKSKSLQ